VTPDVDKLSPYTRTFALDVFVNETDVKALILILYGLSSEYGIFSTNDVQFSSSVAVIEDVPTKNVVSNVAYGAMGVSVLPIFAADPILSWDVYVFVADA
jgi:hypothetical protein